MVVSQIIRAGYEIRRAGFESAARLCRVETETNYEHRAEPHTRGGPDRRPGARRRWPHRLSPRRPTSWEDPVNDSALGALLLLVGVPLVIIAVIALLTYLPSMMRVEVRRQPLAFQERPEWFGGPRQGAEAAADSETATSTDKGGASARW